MTFTPGKVRVTFTRDPVVPTGKQIIDAGPDATVIFDTQRRHLTITGPYVNLRFDDVMRVDCEIYD